ncbi:MAG: enoyl-CoA hydratase [Alphaproteobacteria bacterium]|nr:enoyl-CoA hydratase [Alphaproteobacteria bacterium]
MREIYDTLALERPGPGLLRVTLNRPDFRNALNTQMGLDLRDLFQNGLNQDPGGVRCVVLTGAGDKAFCAGGDLKERDGMSDAAWRAQHIIFEEAIYGIMDCPLPVIAAVNGAAFGGGCEIALACDFAYAATGVRFALTEVTLGILPGCGGTQNLPRVAGGPRAREILMTGRPFSAQEALEWGIINLVCEPAQLLEQALETARAICANAPLSVKNIKQAVNGGLQTDLKSGLKLELAAYDKVYVSEDRREGVRAFNEKRKAEFKGI